MNCNKFLVFTISTLLSVHALAQNVLYSAQPAPQPASYYVSLNGEGATKSVQEIADTKLSLKYEDRIGSKSQMGIDILDWRRQVVKRVSLSKSLGLNYYDVDLNKLSDSWERNSVYYVRFVDENSNSGEVSFRIAEKKNAVPPSVNIFVNPINTQCDNLSKSSIAYLAEIQGGKTPYRITWYVMNNAQTELLFQPKEEFVERGSQSPMISVDAFLDYYVLLHVEDACGTTAKQMVHIKCEDEGEQVNTIFVQPLGNYNDLIQKTR